MYQPPKSAGAVRYNVPKSCAARLCRACGNETACVAVRYLILRICLDMGAHCAPIRKKKSSAVPLFRSGRRSLICARLSNKGKAGVQRGRETAGVPSFLPPRRVPQSPALRRAQFPAESQRKTPRPLGANTLTQFVHPVKPVQKKEPPR